MKEDFDGPDVDGELYFEPAISATGAEPTVDSRPAKRRNSKLRRKLGAGVVLASALVMMGGAFTLFAGTSGATDTGNDQASVAAGHQLYSVSCITCHGANLQGVKDRGPSLLGVGSAAVIFQVSTGRMPATGQGPEQDRKTAKFTDAQTSELAAYVQSLGGGPELPATLTDNSNVAEGGDLFRLNCASCHGTTGKGA
ncbi:MAG: c-type cytochrome, partial [Jatrophihabitantaceae bacterium]